MCYVRLRLSYIISLFSVSAELVCHHYNSSLDPLVTAYNISPSKLLTEAEQSQFRRLFGEQETRHRRVNAEFNASLVTDCLAQHWLLVHGDKVVVVLVTVETELLKCSSFA